MHGLMMDTQLLIKDLAIHAEKKPRLSRGRLDHG